MRIKCVTISLPMHSRFDTMTDFNFCSSRARKLCNIVLRMLNRVQGTTARITHDWSTETFYARSYEGDLMIFCCNNATNAAACIA